jgi:hypothetical protein
VLANLREGKGITMCNIGFAFFDKLAQFAGRKPEIAVIPHELGKPGGHHVFRGFVDASLDLRFNKLLQLGLYDDGHAAIIVTDFGRRCTEGKQFRDVQK